MKKVALSLVAISVLSSSAFADIKVKSFSGDAKLFYSAVKDDTNSYSDKVNNAGDASVSLKGALSVNNGSATVNWGVTGISTLGLDGHLVGKTWITHQKSATDTTLTDGFWLDTLNLTINPFANNTLIIGRQQLDTPMVFSEQWNIAPNTYDAVVWANTYFKNTTLIGAWVGRTNMNGTTQFFKNDESFVDFGTKDGAYAFAIVNKSFCDTTLQAWYFDVIHAAKVGWLQADSKFMGLDYGVQYATRNPSVGNTGTAVAAKIGGSIDGLGLSAAYSTVSDDGQDFVNVMGGQSKLYTDAWWMVGTVAQADTKAYTLTASYDLGFTNSSLYYTHSKTGSVVTKETTLTFDKSLGNLDASLAVVNVKNDITGKDDEVQLYLTYHF